LPNFTLKELAKKLSLKYEGDPDCILVGVAALSLANSTELSFCRSSKQVPLLEKTKAGAVIISPELSSDFLGNRLLAVDPQQALINALALLHPKPAIIPFCHPTAVIHESVMIPESAFIGPGVVIGARVLMGKNVVIPAGCFIGDDCRLGDDVCLGPHVVLYNNVRLGNRVSIHASSVIGADGFGYHRQGFSGPWQKVAQIGGVLIEDDVEIGASTTIDCGAISDTHISRGVKIDNQVMIAHNVFIGEDTVIAGCSGVAGSTNIGSNCILAGHCGVADNLTITNNVILLGKASVSNSIKEPGMYGSGTGLLTRAGWLRLIARLRNLDRTIMKINKKLEKIND
jgi:UDP-3-O-[3-hydroxymyristoyl] glucosamine N-acyltransferase